MTHSTHALARAAERDLPHADADSARVIAAGTRILVVDGDPERQWLLSDALLRRGVEGAVAPSGADAVALLQDAGADFPAVLVGGLPDGSRRGFVSWARPRFPELAIVTLADDTGEATALYNAGADIVTVPPIDPDLLGAKIRAALRRARISGQ